MCHDSNTGILLWLVGATQTESGKGRETRREPGGTGFVRGHCVRLTEIVVAFREIMGVLGRRL